MRTVSLAVPQHFKTLPISKQHHATNGATTQDQVADKITEKVNSGLGLEYDINNGATNYASIGIEKMHLANFTLFLKDGSSVKSARTGYHQNPTTFLLEKNDSDTVNCSDCAEFVVAFSNVVGGGLIASKISNQHALNQIIAIGGTNFPHPNWARFSYHAFTSNSANNIWDACLKVRDGYKTDPTDPASGNDAKLPVGMPHKKTNLATATTPVLVKSAGSDANGMLTITKVYQEDNHNGVVPASCTLTCTPNNTAFTLNCGRNGTLAGITLTGASVDATLSKDGIKIIDFKLEKGTKPFCVGDKFTFELEYDFSDYRSSLAAPDWKMGVGGTQGRTPAGTKTPYVFGIQ